MTTGLTANALPRSIHPVTVSPPSPLGLAVRPLPGDGGGGVYVTSVQPSSQAESAGIRPGDVISYPGTSGRVRIPMELFEAICKARPVVFDVVRSAREGASDGSVGKEGGGAEETAPPAVTEEESSSAGGGTTHSPPSPSSSSSSRRSTVSTGSAKKAPAQSAAGRVNDENVRNFSSDSGGPNGAPTATSTVTAAGTAADASRVAAAAVKPAAKPTRPAMVATATADRAAGTSTAATSTNTGDPLRSLLASMEAANGTTVPQSIAQLIFSGLGGGVGRPASSSSSRAAASSQQQQQRDSLASSSRGSGPNSNRIDWLDAKSIDANFPLVPRRGKLQPPLHWRGSADSMRRWRNLSQDDQWTERKAWTRKSTREKDRIKAGLVEKMRLKGAKKKRPAPTNVANGASSSSSSLSSATRAASGGAPPPSSFPSSSSSSSIGVTRIKPETSSSSGPSSSTPNTAATTEVIELLDSDDEEGVIPSRSNATSRDASKATAAATLTPAAATPARTGAATHFQPKRMRFPAAIDTLFDGNATNIPTEAQGVGTSRYYYSWERTPGKKKKTEVSLTEIRQVKTVANQIGDLKYIWPMDTPVAEVSGGFFETVHKAQPVPSGAGGTNNKKAKTSRGMARKTHSRIGRLAGMITVPVHVATKEVRDMMCNDEGTFFWAEDLVLAERKGRKKRCISGAAMAILEAVMALNDRENPFKERCLYVIAESMELPSFRSSVADDVFVDVVFHVYFRRALFGLSANPSIKVVLDALKPLPSQRPWVDCREVPEATNRFKRSPRPDAGGSASDSSRFDHSLPGILWYNESEGYPVTPSSLSGYKRPKVTLRDYQRETVAWMRDQENLSGSTGGGVPGLNGYFWCKRTFPNSSDCYYYFPLGGHVLLQPPPVVSGGLLAEEMGLGKTVLTIELVCSNAASRPKGAVVRPDQIKLGGTLIVVPVSLLSQWKEEMRTKAPHLSVEIYYGDIAKSYETYRTSDSKTIASLATFDVVLTTMSKLQELTRSGGRPNNRMLVLNKIKWYRLVVDECQFLKNDTTAIARAASAIDSRHVWMLSGTPLTNKLDDLRGELSLLRVWPFTLGTSSDAGWMDHFWTGNVKEPWDSRDDTCLPVVRTLMRAVSMRHSRLQTRVEDGTPLVALPERTERFVAVRQPQKSSDAFISKWLEAAAASLLDRLGRVDIRLFGQIEQLRKVASSGALLSLENVNEAQSLLLKESLLAAGSHRDEFRQLTLHAAALEWKRNFHSSSLVLHELVQLANQAKAGGTISALSPCSYCRGARTHPAYLSCDHGLCAGCCRALMKPNGFMKCPTCSSEVPSSEIVEIAMPSGSGIAGTSSTVPPTTAEAAAASSSSAVVDLDINEEDQLNNLLRMTENEPTAASNDESPSSTAIETIDIDAVEEVAVTYLDGEVDFHNKDTNIVHTLESLKSHPEPSVTISTAIRKEYPNVPGALLKHVLACENRSGPSPKIKAVVDEIYKIRADSLEAKICVFSSFGGVLNELEAALSTITYDVLLEASGKMKLDAGQRVILIETESSGIVEYVYDNGAGCRYSMDSYYGIKLDGENQMRTVSRRELIVDAIEINNVPSALIRKDSNDSKISINGSDDRYDVMDQVQSRRPPVASTDLRLGFVADIIPVDGEEWVTGKIERVRRSVAGGTVTYDVKPDGRPLVENIPASRLEDRGSQEYRSAIIKRINSSRSVNNEEDTSGDPYESAIGYVRLDGSAGNAHKRGVMLDHFRNDPMTSLCLITKRAAAVGLNLTNANHVIILEPSTDAHEESQSICRVHRIGQTRAVTVLKFFVEGGIEERVLKRRAQRGELSISINATTGASDDGDADSEGTGTKDLSKKASEGVASSVVMTLEDLKLLLGK